MGLILKRLTSFGTGSLGLDPEDAQGLLRGADSDCFGVLNMTLCRTCSSVASCLPVSRTGCVS